VKILLVDAGNSNIKWSLLDGDHLFKMESQAYGETSSIDVYKEILTKILVKFKINTVIVVSVLGDTFIRDAEEYTSLTVDNFINAKSEPHLAGVTNAYRDFSKLGADRFVAMIAAYHLNNSGEKSASIVVDSGTATTIDTIDMNGQHLGGVILSGLDLCSQNLLQNTELLPLFNKNRDTFEPKIFSSDTTEAIANGSLFGLAGAITHISMLMEQEIREKTSYDGNINIIITGGGARKLAPFLNKDFQVQENLLMLGLKMIVKIKNDTKI